MFCSQASPWRRYLTFFCSPQPDNENIHAATAYRFFA